MLHDTIIITLQVLQNAVKWICNNMNHVMTLTIRINFQALVQLTTLQLKFSCYNLDLIYNNKYGCSKTLNSFYLDRFAYYISLES